MASIHGTFHIWKFSPICPFFSFNGYFPKETHEKIIGACQRLFPWLFSLVACIWALKPTAKSRNPVICGSPK